MAPQIARTSVAPARRQSDLRRPGDRAGTSSGRSTGVACIGRIESGDRFYYYSARGSGAMSRVGFGWLTWMALRLSDSVTTTQPGAGARSREPLSKAQPAFTSRSLETGPEAF